MTTAPMTSAPAFDLIRPLVWIAAGAFLAGFAIVLAAAALTDRAELHVQAEPPAWTASAPAEPARAPSPVVAELQPV